LFLGKNIDIKGLIVHSPFSPKLSLRKLEKLRAEHAAATQAAREQAASTIKLMTNTVARKKAQEEAKNGTIICFETM
jgi:hypothetical protein